MLLLVDENVPDSATNFFRERGHDVRLVRDLFPPGTPDPAIAALGESLGAIVVTWNQRDFKKLAYRGAPPGDPYRFHRLGRLNFRCKEAHGRRRAGELIEWIEFEFEQVQKRRDKRLMIEVTETTLVVVR